MNFGKYIALLTYVGYYRVTSITQLEFEVIPYQRA